MLGRGKKNKADKEFMEQEAVAAAVASPTLGEGGGPVAPDEPPAIGEEPTPAVDALAEAGDAEEDDEEGLGDLEGIFEPEDVTMDEGFLSLVASADEISVEELHEALEDLLAAMEEIDAVAGDPVAG